MVRNGKSFEQIKSIIAGKKGLGFNASMIINNEIMREDRNEESSL